MHVNEKRCSPCIPSRTAAAACPDAKVQGQTHRDARAVSLVGFGGRRVVQLAVATGAKAGERSEERSWVVVVDQYACMQYGASAMHGNWEMRRPAVYGGGKNGEVRVASGTEEGRVVRFAVSLSGQQQLGSAHFWFVESTRSHPASSCDGMHARGLLTCTTCIFFHRRTLFITTNVVLEPNNRS